MTTKRILTFEQERQITTITIIKGTQGITASTKRIIRTVLTLKE